MKDGRVELDETASALRVKAGKHFTVHLNGAAPSSFLAALRTVGIGEERVSATLPDLQAAIRRALTVKRTNEESN